MDDGAFKSGKGVGVGNRWSYSWQPKAGAAKRDIANTILATEMGRDRRSAGFI